MYELIPYPSSEVVYEGLAIDVRTVSRSVPPLSSFFMSTVETDTPPISGTLDSLTPTGLDEVPGVPVLRSRLRVEKRREDFYGTTSR